MAFAQSGLLIGLRPDALAGEGTAARAADPHPRRRGSSGAEGAGQDEEIAGIARSKAALRTLWDVAQVPDFRKTLFDQHTQLLGQIYRYLLRGAGRIPEDFVEAQVSRLDNLQGDIDALVNRIAAVRTWTFISHRGSWVTNAKYWQEKARKIDDKLSTRYTNS